MQVAIQDARDALVVEDHVLVGVLVLVGVHVLDVPHAMDVQVVALEVVVIHVQLALVV